MNASRPDGPDLRIGDAEREAAVSALGEHYASGRLTRDEYDERSEAAYAARTRSALYPLFGDLPRPEGEPAGPVRPMPATGPPPRPVERGPRWRGGLMPVLVVVIAIALLTKLSTILLAVVVWVLLVKVMHLWGHSHGRTSWHRHHSHNYGHPHR